MSNEQNVSRFFGGCFGKKSFDGSFILILIVGALLLLGDDILEWLFCEEMALIWVVLLIFILCNFDSCDGCGCC